MRVDTLRFLPQVCVYSYTFEQTVTIACVMRHSNTMPVKLYIDLCFETLNYTRDCLIYIDLSPLSFQFNQSSVSTQNSRLINTCRVRNRDSQTVESKVNIGECITIAHPRHHMRKLGSAWCGWAREILKERKRANHWCVAAAVSRRR